VETVDVLVVGAGVVGLAVARALALAGREVVVLEQAEAIGTGTSSRNSEVIHAGLYYAPGSLKARLCVAGKHALYAYCRERGIAHRNCGKLIVATSDAQMAELERIRAQAAANGVTDLRMLDRGEAQRMEPALECVAALHSPSTGIVDSHGLMLALQGDAEGAGASVVLRSPVRGGRLCEDGTVEIEVGGVDPLALRTRLLVNCAGLDAARVTASVAGFPPSRVPRTWLAKGSYFMLAGRSPFSHLVYPVPEPGGLGVHLTLDLAGAARFGPDVEWVTEIDYRVDARRADGFYGAIRSYWPALPDDGLLPAYAGIRPKIAGPGMPAADFLVEGPREHGVPGVVNLFGIESPGLTAALAIAEEVVLRASGD
jgi:L-2-hydroxyglutarate oxidase LhgO